MKSLKAQAFFRQCAEVKQKSDLLIGSALSTLLSNFSFNEFAEESNAEEGACDKMTR